VAHLATCIFLFSNEPEFGEGINPGMALTPFPSSILAETNFEPTTSRSGVHGPHVARLMWLCGPRHHKKLLKMAEIKVLGAIKAPYTLY